MDVALPSTGHQPRRRLHCREDLRICASVDGDATIVLAAWRAWQRPATKDDGPTLEARHLEGQELELVKIDAEDTLADLLTKPIP